MCVEQSCGIWKETIPESCSACSNSPEPFARGQKIEKCLCQVTVVVHEALCLLEAACNVDVLNCWLLYADYFQSCCNNPLWDFPFLPVNSHTIMCKQGIQHRAKKRFPVEFQCWVSVGKRFYFQSARTGVGWWENARSNCTMWHLVPDLAACKSAWLGWKYKMQSYNPQIIASHSSFYCPDDSVVWIVCKIASSIDLLWR